MFSDQITSLRKERTTMTQTDFAKILGVAKTTYASYEQGKRMPDMDIQQKIADYYGVSLDYLHGRNNFDPLSGKEKSDIAIQADNLLEGIENGGDLNFYGEPASEEQKERLRVAIRTAMEMNKEEAKKKFNPKKNKK